MMFQGKWKVLITSIILSVSAVSATPSLVSGIAFFVNGDPVTLVELYKTQQREKVSQDVAVDRLINERLHEEEIKKRKLSVNDLEIEDEIRRVAKQNKTTLEKVRKYVEGNGGNWNTYKEDIKKRF